MPATSARSIQRMKAKTALKDTKTLFREALHAGEHAERTLKAVINTEPLRTRIGIAGRILIRRWR